MPNKNLLALIVEERTDMIGADFQSSTTRIELHLDTNSRKDGEFIINFQTKH